MEILQSVIQYILDLGAAVFVPFLMLIVGLAMKMKFRDGLHRDGNLSKLHHDKYGFCRK